MSRQNKVNPDHYTMAGRLTPDDLARQWQQQREAKGTGLRRQKRKPGPPWMASDQNRASDESASHDDAPASTAAERNPSPGDDALADAEQAEMGKPRRKSAKTQAQRARKAGTTRGEKKKTRKAVRRKTDAQPAPTGRGRQGKASGARGTPKTRKSGRARGTAARGDSPKRQSRPAIRTGRTKGKGITRRASKKR